MMFLSLLYRKKKFKEIDQKVEIEKLNKKIASLEKILDKSKTGVIFYERVRQREESNNEDVKVQSLSKHAMASLN